MKFLAKLFKTLLRLFEHSKKSGFLSLLPKSSYLGGRIGYDYSLLQKVDFTSHLVPQGI